MMLDAQQVTNFCATNTWARLSKKDLVFTVTSGRSGTKLLTALLRRSLRICAEHEPAPRANFFLRETIRDPNYGLLWLINEKLPFIEYNYPGASYVETSHIYCKGFIEAFFALQLKMRFIVLRRDASSVARSLYKMTCIPERTDAGKMVLIGPSDPNVLTLPDWENYSDYQLCYWYAKEIERRQNYYAARFEAQQIPFFDLRMEELLDWKSFLGLCRFLDPDGVLGNPDEREFAAVTAENQNPRNVAREGNTDAMLPHDVEEQERSLDHATSIF
jgi:hypothetical protein